MKKKVLVVGSGDRVQSGILPALLCLHDSHEITAIISRSKKTLTVFGNTTKVQDSYSDIDFKNLDLIIIAVPANEVPGLLEKLSKYKTKQCTLLIDTPVLPLTFRGLWAAKHFNNFKKAFATEESVALPNILLAKQIIMRGNIGSLESIHMFHSGYRYHALASLKTLAGHKIRSIMQKNYPYDERLKKVTFANSSRAFLYEPFRPPGTFLVTGSEGYIADYDHHGDKPTERIGYLVRDGLYTGLTLNGTPVEKNLFDKVYLRTIQADVFDGSSLKVKNAAFTNSMKIRALMDTIADATEDIPHLAYPAREAYKDSLRCAVVEKLGFSFF